MARIRYKRKLEGGWTVADFLAYYLGFLRGRLGSWLEVSHETGIALSTVRRIRHNFGITGVAHDGDYTVELLTFRRIKKVFHQHYRKVMLQSHGRKGLSPFVPRLTGII